MKRYSVEEKKEGHRTFEEILDRLDSMGRGPDHWEENSLVHAINFMECGLYDRAGTALRECVLPTDERPAWRLAQIERNPQRYTVARLRMRFAPLRSSAR